MNIDDRMKAYEHVYRPFIMPRMPVIIRVDGKAFHTLTRTCERPFDKSLADAMDYAAMALVDEIQNARISYTQSDEISILLVDYNKFDSQQWFGGNINKMVSISACIASQAFSEKFGRKAYFDSRVFVLPEREVCNYFIWRQQDATRNSISMAAQSRFSHKQLHGVSTDQAQEMLFQDGINWNDYPTRFKRGGCSNGTEIDNEIPIFTQNRNYIEKHLEIEE